MTFANDNSDDTFDKVYRMILSTNISALDKTINNCLFVPRRKEASENLIQVNKCVKKAINYIKEIM